MFQKRGRKLKIKKMMVKTLKITIKLFIYKASKHFNVMMKLINDYPKYFLRDLGH